MASIRHSATVLIVCITVCVTFASPIDPTSIPTATGAPIIEGSTTPTPNLISANNNESMTTAIPTSINTVAHANNETISIAPAVDMSTSATSPSSNNNATTAEKATSLISIVPTILKFPENIGNWSVKGNNNGTNCIEFLGAIQLGFIYHDSKTNKTEAANLDVPKDNSTTVGGTCGQTTQMLSITWQRHNETTNNTILFTFEKTPDNKTLLTKLDGTIISESLFSNFNFTVTNITNLNKPAPEKAFKCNAILAFPGTHNVTLKLAGLKFISFNAGNSTSEKQQIVCSEDAHSGSVSGWEIFGYVCLTIFMALLILVIAAGVVYYYRNLRNPGNAYSSM